MMDRDDLRGLTVDEVLNFLERGKVGHTAVMDYLRITSLVQLVDIMHANGRQMPGHKPMPIRRKTLDMLRQVMMPLPPGDAVDLSFKKGNVT